MVRNLKVTHLRIFQKTNNLHTTLAKDLLKLHFYLKQYDLTFVK